MNCIKDCSLRRSLPGLESAEDKEKDKNIGKKTENKSAYSRKGANVAEEAVVKGKR